MNLLVLVIPLAGLLVVSGGWLAYQLLRQNGRILSRLDALETQMAGWGPGYLAEPVAGPGPPQGLPVGSPAPDFELDSLAGGRKRLSGWRGRRVLLLFFNPRCGFCSRMLPDLAALPIEPAGGRPLPLLVTTGSTAENRKLVEEHGLRCPVLLSDGGELSARYQATGTPMGYLLDEEGRIASELAVGAEALLALAGTGVPLVDGKSDPKHRGNRSLSESRLNRSGLAAGTPAPAFRVPCLGGGELSLAEYQGRRVLLVFSDPHCGPCEALAPRLEQAGRERPDVQVLMVSRGDLEANRRKVAELGLTFPVGLQRQWEISKLYAMFATPIAYLIDTEGVIAADVAVGVEPILALLAGPESPAVVERRLEVQSERAPIPA